MNRSFVLMILLGLGFIQISFSKIPQDSIQAYDYWAQHGIVKLVYAYMLDQDSISEPEKQGIDLFKNKFIDSDYANLDSASVFLKSHSWGNTEVLVFHPLYTKYKNKAPLTLEFFNIPSKNGDIYTSTKWANTCRFILSNYSETLNSYKPYKARADDPTDNISEGNSNRHPKSINWSGLVRIISIFLFGFVLGGFLVYMITRQKVYSILDVEIRNYLSQYSHSSERFVFKYIGVINILKTRKDEYKKDSESKRDIGGNEILKLKDEIAQLERDKGELLEENIRLGKTVENQKYTSPTEGGYSPTSPFATNSEDSKPLQKIFFSMPESDGSFQIINGEPSNDGKKYFRVECEKSSTIGSLYFLSGERDKRAINRLESYLKPVCDIENIANSATATRIEQKEPGKVSLLHDSWTIDQENKVKIKLY